MNRSAPLRSRTPLRRRTPLRAQSAKRERLIPPAAADAVKARSGGRCEAVGLRSEGRCQNPGQHLHHRLMRSQGGANTAANLLDVCAWCHHDIHLNPARSYELGLLVRRAAA